MTGADVPKEIDDMVRVWAERATVPFQGHPRSGDIEHALKLTITLAFQVVESSIPQLKGVRFGYRWDEENQIAVLVAPKDELTDDMLVIEIGEKIDTGKLNANRYN